MADLSPNQRRTAAARAALAAKFPDAEAKAEHYRQLGARGHAERLTLNGDERAALAECYTLLHRIAMRHGFYPDVTAVDPQAGIPNGGPLE